MTKQDLRAYLQKDIKKLEEEQALEKEKIKLKGNGREGKGMVYSHLNYLVTRKCTLKEILELI